MANSPNSQVLFLNVVFSDVFGNLFLLGQKFTQILLIEKQSHFFLDGERDGESRMKYFVVLKRTSAELDKEELINSTSQHKGFLSSMSFNNQALSFGHYFSSFPSTWRLLPPPLPTSPLAPPLFLADHFLLCFHISAIKTTELLNLQ